MAVVKKTLLTLLAAVVAASVMAGCGEAPGTVVDDGKNMKDLRLNQNNQGVPQQNQQALIQQIMQGVTATRAQVNSIRCDLTGYFVNEKDGKSGSNLAKFAFEKPNKTSVQMIQSSDPKTVGTKIVWTGGKQMAVKTKFIGFWVKASIDVRDPRAVDQRGFFLDETGINPLMDTLLDPRNQTQVVGTGNLNGVPVAQLSVVSPRSLRGISREVFVIDGQRMVPIVREMYDKSNKLVFRIRMDNMVLNSSLPSSTFQLE